MLDKLKQSKYWIAAILVSIVATFFITRQLAPAKVEYKKDESVVAELEETKLKLSESLEQISKMKSSQEKKSKVLITNADGSSVLKEFSDSSSLEVETQSLLQKNAEQALLISSLQTKLSESSVEKNKQNGLFFGPGYSTAGKPVGGVDLLSGNFMGSIVSDSKEHAALIKWGLYF